MTPAQFWAIEQGNQQNQRENMQQMTNQVFQSAGQLAGMYAENKAMEAKASSYDKIGDILGSAMFSGNDVAINALGELKKSKDPREKVMGYEALLSFVGPYSNFMMANQRIGVQQAGQAQAARMPGVRNQAAAQAQVAAGQGRMTTLPSNINADAIP
jgi:hypothetical protein